MRLVMPLALAAMLGSTAIARQLHGYEPARAAFRERTRVEIGAQYPIWQALDDTSRPAADRAQDERRHPISILRFAGIAPDQKVADFIMGGGYWTRILAGVVGPGGRVYAYQPAEFIALRAQYGVDQDTAAKPYANVVPSRERLGEVTFPEPLDVILTVQNWHDLHTRMAPAGLGALEAKALFKALKPGGVLVVVDHVGLNVAGPFADADTLHRGDPAATRAELVAAGFRYDGEGIALINPNDPHTALVFDPSIRGRTDQFEYRFKKPG